MKVQPWIRCECGKIHVATYVTMTTTCNCGRKLEDQVPVRSTNAR